MNFMGREYCPCPWESAWALRERVDASLSLTLYKTWQEHPWLRSNRAHESGKRNMSAEDCSGPIQNVHSTPFVRKAFCKGNRWKTKMGESNIGPDPVLACTSRRYVTSLTWKQNGERKYADRWLGGLKKEKTRDVQHGTWFEGCRE